jgi:hypothetical protein
VADAELHLQTRRFDIFGFILLALGMATLTLALDGKKGLGISPLLLARWWSSAWPRFCSIYGTPGATTTPCSA